MSDQEKIAKAVQDSCGNRHPELPYTDFSKSSVENFMTCSCPEHRIAAFIRGLTL